MIRGYVTHLEKGTAFWMVPLFTDDALIASRLCGEACGSNAVRKIRYESRCARKPCTE
jgi:hypothetical protein